MKIVFYGHRYGSFINKLIRWYTSPLKRKLNGKWRDTFSHVELLFDDGLMFSASQYENKVRFKPHSYTGKAWVRVDLDLTPEQVKQVRQWCEKQVGKKYDYLGIAGFVFGNRDNSNKWFCSEVCTAALQQVGKFRGVKASKVSPNKLAKMLNLN